MGIGTGAGAGSSVSSRALRDTNPDANINSRPDAIAHAPGRVNLLGEHTDYNDGYVLPIAISQQTRVAMSRNGRTQFRLFAHELDQTVHFTLEQPPTEHFASYVFGCLKLVHEMGVSIEPLDIEVTSEVPIGMGLSSSAALEVATLRCLGKLLSLPLDDEEIARLAQRAEIEYAGVHCGILDQMASSLAGTDVALFLDIRTMQRRDVPLPDGSGVLVLDSGIERSLANTGYNQRRKQCEQAAQLLGVASLRDVPDLASLAKLPELLQRRVRHVFTENQRVLQAVQTTSAREFGSLMNSSHASLRDDYEVSVPELDTLVALLKGTPGVFGARLTGAGFGGACVALCANEALDTVSAGVLEEYHRLGQQGRQLVPVPRG